MDKEKDPAEQLSSIRGKFSGKPTTRSDIKDKPKKDNYISQYPGAVVFDEKGEIATIKVSSTLIKKFFAHGEEIEYCPYKNYRCFILGDVREPTTTPQLYGLYFETMTIGEGRGGTRVTELPRLRNGDKTTDNIRIDEQIHRFSVLAKQYGMVINREPPNKNVQVNFQVKYEPRESFEHKDIAIILSATSDILTPVTIRGFDVDVAVVDIKLTKDRDSTYGIFSWGDPKRMDHTQGILYSSVFEKPFAYFVFDYRKNDRGHKFLPLITMADFINVEITEENRARYNVAKLRMRELQNTIERLISLIVKHHVFGWEKIPSSHNCKDCPLSAKLGGDCNKYTNIENPL